MKKLLLLCLLPLVLFEGSFKTGIFQDDFYLFTISRAQNITDFVNFFSPIKPYGFYRPISIEIFYFLAGLLNNLVTIRIFVFAIFGLGIVFLYKVIKLLSKDESLALLTSLIYLASFTHVFQLYWLATFQEVAMMTCSLITAYYYLSDKYKTAIIFFLLALLCREQAMILPIALLFLKGLRKELIPLLLLVIPFAIIYFINFQTVAIRPEYRPDINLKLIINNSIWYSLWSLGIPNYFSDFWPSLLTVPGLPLLSAIIRSNSQYYLTAWVIFFIILLIAFIKNANKRSLSIIAYCLILFCVYILPISFILHKWMVRLTVPTIFISFIIAYLAKKSSKVIGVTLVIFYLVYNFLGIKVHENTSTYRYETQITKNAYKYLQEIKLSDGDTIYFSDEKISSNGWEGSQKLKLTLFDQSFLRYWYPNKNIKAIYGFEGPPPQGTKVIKSELLL